MRILAPFALQISAPSLWLWDLINSELACHVSTSKELSFCTHYIFFLFFES